ncbi:Isy1p SCDLUD_003375 [Saccharomycodes ludwigii]|uniref:Isy1p n=1 Tax=Saccharomycodes ludwigii TaxID=36035 RepID=UPI001E85223A|nr:hypothetical protein SCDLUD_003375 [Saccharomycodes ludwigii]KAH3900396.1 hypothetical protein SCDLUD_003375 [Saccharomycodes ludwigii]
MSRNVDKANSVLARIQELQAEENSNYKNYSRYKRPKSPYKIQSLQECYNWRREINRDLDQVYTKLFDLSINSTQIKELVAKYNVLLQELKLWDKHIVKDLHGQPSRRKYNNKKVLRFEGQIYVGRGLELIKDKMLPKNGPDNNTNQKLFRKKIRVDNRYYNFKDMKHDIFSQPVPKTPQFSIPTRQDIESWLVEKRKGKLKAIIYENST